MAVIKNLKKFIYRPSTTLKKAIGDLYRRDVDICLVCENDGTLLGLLTIGDIKKAILDGYDPNSPVSTVMNVNFTAAKTMSESKLKLLSLKKTRYNSGILEKVPILDSRGRLNGLYLNEDVYPGFKSKTVLVTGGAGYLGSILCRKLLAKHYRVIALDNLSLGDAGIKKLSTNPDFQLIEGDIRNIGDLIAGIKEADYVIHLAGIVGDPASSVDPIHTMESNHFSTKSLIELAKHYQVSRLIFASSCSVYGASARILNEESKLNPVSLYARTKIYAEKELLAAKSNYFHPAIVRFGTLYGVSPHMRFDLVVNIMSANAFFNKKIIVNGGAQWRPLLHVSDAAESCIHAMEAPLGKVSGEIFNVGSNTQNFTIGQVAETIRKLIPGSRIVNKNNGVSDRRDYRVSFTKIKEVLGFTSAVSLDDGVKEIIEKFQNGEYADFRDPKFSNYISNTRNT